MRYRVDDLDRGDRVARLGVRPGAVRRRLAGRGGAARWAPAPPRRGWRCRRCGCGAASTPSWPAPCRPRRLAEHAAVVDRAVPPLREQWPAPRRGCSCWRRRPPPEADALLGRPAGSGAAPVAATTEGPDRGRRHRDRRPRRARPHGVRPAHRERARRRAHARAGPRRRALHRARGARPAWLAEGYADHVGYARADVADRDGSSPRSSIAPSAPATARARCRARRTCSPATRRHRGALPRGVAGGGADRRTTTVRPRCAGWWRRARRPGRTPMPRPPPTGPGVGARHHPGRADRRRGSPGWGAWPRTPADPASRDVRIAVEPEPATCS